MIIFLYPSAITVIFFIILQIIAQKTLATHLWQARDFVIRETGFQGKKRRTHLEKKRFLNDRPLKVQSGRYKCCHLRDIVIYYCNDIFCMSETWLSDNESTTIVASASESHVLYHTLCPDKKRDDVSCLISNSLQSTKQQ